jgi:UDP-2-acetamido-3-amino-2,3-dideoxy-glucuronate N-acetyltransferase
VTPRARSDAPARVYPSAIVAPGAELGPGAVIGAFCFVAEGAKIGAGCRVQSHTSVWAGVELEEDVFVGPAVAFTNVAHPRAGFVRAPDWDLTHVGRGATLGAGAVLVAPLRVGTCAMVGAGSVVTRDVPAYAVVVGNPARVVGWACACGDTLARAETDPPREARCVTCARRYARDGAGLREVEPSTEPRAPR